MHIHSETRSERWGLFYLAACATTVLTTWVGVRYGFLAGALANGFWPELFVKTELAGYLIIAIYVLLTSPVALVLLLALYPARRYVFGSHLRLPRVFILVLLAMAAPFLGLLGLSYNPRIVENLPEYIPALLIASLGYSFCLWLVFALLKRLFRARSPRPIPEVFD